jgi:hypothetical protein
LFPPYLALLGKAVVERLLTIDDWYLAAGHNLISPELKTLNSAAHHFVFHPQRLGGVIQIYHRANRYGTMHLGPSAAFDLRQGGPSTMSRSHAFAGVLMKCSRIYLSGAMKGWEHLLFRSRHDSSH